MKTIRTWVYALMYKDEQILVIKKWKWPFTWLYDLPWGKIEHWEDHIEALKREIFEETWLKETEFEIEKLLLVSEDFVNHIWEWKQKNEHLIFITYLIKILSNNFNLNYKEIDWDAKWLKLINIFDTKIPTTNALKKALLEFNRKYKK